MPQAGKPSIEQSCQESSAQSNHQPVAQPGIQPDAQRGGQPNDCCANESKQETIACRTANALIGDDTVLIPNGFTRYPLKESKQQPEAQSEARPEGQFVEQHAERQA